MSGGRPTKYETKYCQQLVDHMATGASATSFAAFIEVDRSTITEWSNVHPQFSLALSRGKAKCGAWWEKVGRQVATTNTGNATIALFGMRNMAPEDWTNDPNDEGGKANVNVTINRLG